MRSGARFWLGFLGAAVLAACATLAARKAPKADAEVITFSHQLHAKQEIECTACHGAIATSASLDARALPKEKTCLKCHGEWKEEGQCGKCHVTAQPQTWPKRERTVSFSHEQHLPLTDENCARCHQKLPEPDTRAALTPPMQTCLDCHNHQQEYAQARCMPCHTDLQKQGLRPVAWFTHQGDYVHEHRQPARSAPEVCAQCHDQNFCKDCHAQTVPLPVEFVMPERVDRQFIHRNDYLSRHPIEAEADPALCQRCHGQSFCETCHTQVGLTPLAAAARNPHPAGWNVPGTPNFHGPAARRDIVSCAGCHDQGANSNCVECHRVGGIGGNPHPSTFRKQHDLEEARENRMCLVCHS